MRHRDARKEIKYGQSGELDAVTPEAAIVTWESAAGGMVVRKWRLESPKILGRFYS